MVYDYFDKYTFACEMFNEEADKVETLTLNFFPYDNSVQVINPDRGKQLLKRVHMPNITLEKLQIGNIINVFSKLLFIKDCSVATRKTIFHKVESTFVLIKPMPRSEYGKIITFILMKGFRIVQMKNGKIDKDFVKRLYENLSGSDKMPVIIDYLTTDEVIGLELVAPDAVSKWRTCLGASNPSEAAPGTLRQLFGQNYLKNVAHGVSTARDAREMIELFFGYERKLPRITFQATFENCTCCVIKPHAIIDKNLGAIIEKISKSGNFYISAMAMFAVSVVNAEEFYEIYDGVLPEYKAMSIHLAEGKCVALEIKAVDPKSNVVREFAKLCGPRDPDLCRQLYPDSIRALFGKTIVHNAVHCTDLPEDGELEVEYFFRLLANIN